MIARWVLPLYAAAAVLAGGGAALWILPVDVPRPAIEPLALPTPGSISDPSEQAAALLTYDEIARGNVLAADRRPPATRYTPPGTAGEVLPAATSTPAPVPAIRLYGVATGPAGAVALIDANPAIPGAEIYRVGDIVGGYSLAQIAETFVVLVGPNGERTLRLQPREGRSP